MDETIQVCRACDAVADGEDNFCRRCGNALGEERLPAKVGTQRAMTMRRERAGLPTPVKRAATALAIGTALQLGTKLAGRYVAKQAGKRAVASLKPRRWEEPKSAVQPEETKPANPFEGAIAVSESFTVRRVWIRRGDG